MNDTLSNTLNTFSLEQKRKAGFLSLFLMFLFSSLFSNFEIEETHFFL